MSGTVKDFSIHYDAINENNTFTSGDYIKGRIILQLSKETKIDKLYIKVKGEADVHWTERRNDQDHSYSAHETYFKLKQFIIVDRSDDGKDLQALSAQSGEIYGNVVRPGNHEYPFSFQLPQEDMPPSFKGLHGKIKYTLEARMSRSWKLPRTATSTFTFVSRMGRISTHLMSPQFGETDKKMKLFTSGNVSMKANTERMGYMQGEILKIIVDIQNSSSRELKLKYSLDQKQTFIATNGVNHVSKRIFKEVEGPIQSGAQQIVTKEMRIPADLPLSIHHCNIIKLEYTLKVYLDVPYASDPEIKFPLVILPASLNFSPWQSTPGGLQSFGNAGEPGWNNLPSQSAFGPYPPPSGGGAQPLPSAPGLYANPYTPAMHPPPANPGLYPNPYTPVPHPPPANPGMPPPAYTDVYPTPTAPGYYPTPTAPGYYPTPPTNPTPSAPGYDPPPYSSGAFPTPTAPEYCPKPTAPEYGQNPTPTSPDSHPTKT